MSGTALKLFAFFLMVLDHIFQFVGGPIFLTYLGRLSAPIFIFLAIEGFCYTRSKEKYILRLYFFGILMGVIDLLLNTYIVTPEKPEVFNNIFALFFIVCSILYVFDKDIKNKNKFIKWFIYLQPLFIIVVSWFIFYPKYLFFATAILPTVLYVEGSIMFVIIGLALYLLREKPVPRDIAYIVIALSYFPFVEVVSGNLAIFYDRYQWLMVFSVVFFHIYNHKRGAGYKYFFYIGYPLHIIILNFWATMQ